MLAFLSADCGFGGSVGVEGVLCVCYCLFMFRSSCWVPRYLVLNLLLHSCVSYEPDFN